MFNGNNGTQPQPPQGLQPGEQYYQNGQVYTVPGVPAYQHVQGSTNPVVPVNRNDQPYGLHYVPPPTVPAAPQQYAGPQVPVPMAYGYAYAQPATTYGPHNLPPGAPNPSLAHYPQQFQRENNYPTMPPLGSVPIPIPGVRAERTQSLIPMSTPDEIQAHTQHYMGINGFPQHHFTPDGPAEAQARQYLQGRVIDKKKTKDRNNMFGRQG